MKAFTAVVLALCAATGGLLSVPCLWPAERWARPPHDIWRRVDDENVLERWQLDTQPAKALDLNPVRTDGRGLGPHRVSALSVGRLFLVQWCWPRLVSGSAPARGRGAQSPAGRPPVGV